MWIRSVESKLEAALARSGVHMAGHAYADGIARFSFLSAKQGPAEVSLRSGPFKTKTFPLDSLHDPSSNFYLVELIPTARESRATMNRVHLGQLARIRDNHAMPRQVGFLAYF